MLATFTSLEKLAGDMSTPAKLLKNSRSSASADENESLTAVDQEIDSVVTRIAKVKAKRTPSHSKGVDEARCSAGLYLVQTVFAKAAQDEHGMVPLDGPLDPDLVTDLTNDASHAPCAFCHCQCADDLGDGAVKHLNGRVTKRKRVTIRPRCDHCRFYQESTPRRCLGAIGDRSGSIAYILRHSSLHEPPRTKPVNEALISAVTIAFQMTPVSADPRRFLAKPLLVVPHLSALWEPYQDWQHHLATCFEDEKCSMVDWFAAREAKNYMLMAFTTGANAWDHMLRRSALRCRCDPPRYGPPHHPNCDFALAASRRDLR